MGLHESRTAECPTCSAGRDEERDDLYAKLDATQARITELEATLRKTVGYANALVAMQRDELQAAHVRLTAVIRLIEEPGEGAVLALSQWFERTRRQSDARHDALTALRALAPLVRREAGR